MSLAGCRCLVTGASGFIGWHLVHRLVKESAEVSCIVEPGVDREELESVAGISEIHIADLTDLSALQRVVKAAKPSIVFHLAAVGATDPAIEPVRAIRVNIEGTVNLLLALNGSCDLFINTGTCHEYGEGLGRAHASPPERRDGGLPSPTGLEPLRESVPPAPASVYAASKVAAWHFCNVFFRTRGWRIVNLRLFTVYGPRQPARSLVPSVILSGLKEQELPMSGGEQIRDFIFIDDVVAGYLLAAENPASAGWTFNLCSGRGVSLRELVSMIETLEKRVRVKLGALPYRNGEASKIIGDNSLAKEILGWEPKVALEEGLRTTLEWYRQILGERTPSNPAEAANG
ncbi:NAD-dependent epimerase/dehydratase family protein [bacterium]|nr:NAD-dependent epimerase/dehydratase family protein [bacterium]